MDNTKTKKTLTHRASDTLMASGKFHGSATEVSMLLEQYKIYVDSMEKLVTRRQTVHAFFMTVNTSLLAVAGLFLTKDFIESSIAAMPIILGSTAGIAMTLLWWRLSNAYAHLSTIKFVVIHEFERYLPTAPFLAEYREMNPDTDTPSFHSMTKMEMGVPIIFGFCYVVLLLIGILIFSGTIHPKAASPI